MGLILKAILQLNLIVDHEAALTQVRHFFQRSVVNMRGRDDFELDFGTTGQFPQKVLGKQMFRR